MHDFDRLLYFCANNMLCFKVSFWEGSGTYEIEIDGIGKGEHFYVKKCITLKDSVDIILEKAQKFYNEIKK